MTERDEARGESEALPEESALELYEQAPCAYLSMRPDGTLVRVNQTLLEWTGYARENLIGTRFQSILTIGSRIYFETHYAPLIRMQGFANEIAFEVLTADRRVLPVLANSREAREADGRPRFTRVTIFDATDRRRYERELLLARRRAEQVARDKADLLSMLSHDIRNPLHAIMGLVQLLDRSDLDDTQRRQLQLVRSSSESMLGLLDRVLEMSRAEAGGGFAAADSVFSLRKLFEDIAATFEEQAQRKGIKLESEIDLAVPSMVVGDPIALRQVITNLLGNAVKFTERGAVTLRANVRESAADALMIAVAVEDTGVGIPADRVEQVFNEYTQASYETAAKFGGSGLGLAIARKLLAIYGSSIQVRSTPGEGSTFSFTLRLSLP